MEIHDNRHYRYVRAYTTLNPDTMLGCCAYSLPHHTIILAISDWLLVITAHARLISYESG